MSRFLSILLCALPILAQGPPKALPTDPQIEAQLHDRLAKSVIGKDAFAVHVKGGVVYWDGSTTVAQHKGAATRMAKSAGARRVVNNITVKKSSSSAGQAGKSAARPVAKTATIPVPLPPPAVSPAVPSAVPPTAPAPPNRVALKWRETRP